MFFIFVCACLLGYCFVLTKHAAFSIEMTPFFVISSVILLLYFFAYINLLNIGSYSILIAGGLFFLYSFCILYKDRQVLFEKYFTAPFVVWIMLSLVIFLFATRTYPMSWDELGFWGVQVKFVALNHGLIKAHDYISHKSYPIGASLFYYLFFPLGHFSESTMMAARQLLVLCPLLAMFRSHPLKQWWRVVAIYILGIFIFLYYLLHFSKGPVDIWNELYIDIPIAFFLGAILIQYRLSKQNFFDLLKLIPLICAFLLLKVKLGVSLALVLVIIIADQLIQGLWALVKMRIGLNCKVVIMRVMGIVILLVAALFVAHSWTLYYTQQLHVVAERQLPHLTPLMIWHIITMQKLSLFQLGVVQHFYHESRILLIYSIFFFGVSIWIAFLETKQKERYQILMTHFILMHRKFKVFTFTGQTHFTCG
jgi:hypothetical protein